MSTIKRDLYHVEPSIRPSIVRRIVFYWGSCVLFSTLPLIIGTTIANSNQLFYQHLGTLAIQYWPLYLMLFGVLPFAIKDALRSHQSHAGATRALASGAEAISRPRSLPPGPLSTGRLPA